MTRLGSTHPELTAAIDALDQVGLRRVARYVAEAAIQRAGLSDVRIGKAMQALASGSVDDGLLRSGVEALTSELDDAYFDLYEEGRPADQYLSPFEGARASAAIWYALDHDPQIAAMESTYEAQAAGVPIEDILDAIRRASPDTRTV